MECKENLPEKDFTLFRVHWNITRMECKAYKEKFASIQGIDWNITRMECKVKAWDEALASAYDWNITRMECKALMAWAVGAISIIIGI